MTRMTKRQLEDALEEARRTIAGLQASRGGVDSETLLESRFAELLADSLPGIAYLFDPSGLLLWWNRNMERVTGYSDLELAGASILDLVAAEDRSLVAQRMGQVIETGEISVEGHLVARDGRRAPYLFSGRHVLFAGGPCLIGMGLDLSELKQTEQGLRRSEARKGAILEAALDCIITIDHNEHVLEFNPAAEQTFGYRRDEVLGRRMAELIIPPGYREAHAQGMRRYLETGVAVVLGRRIELPAMRADGSEFPAEISIVPTVLDGQTIFTAYLRDITDRQRSEELRAAKIAAERATKAKDEFLAMISHELRTPLNGVIGMVELLSDSGLGDQQRRYAQVARTSADLLLAIINDILDLSRIESGKLELDPTEFNPAEVVEEVASMLAHRAEERKLELAFHVLPEVDTWLLGDRGRLRQVLTNLVANAIKFTERGEVVVRAEAEERSGSQVRLRFTVADTGIGIPADRIGHLFQPFTQADASTSRRYGGSGLGLAISRHLTEAMGGEIQAESVAGVGSTFSFSVILESVSPPVTSDPQPVAALHGVRALIVDDNATNREILHDQLTAAGMVCEAAADGPEAIARLERAARAGCPFGMAILDYNMPGLSGEQLGQAIKSDRDLAATVLVLLCSMTHRAAASELRRTGFAAWASKPLGGPQLLRLLAGALNGTEAAVAAPVERPPAASARARRLTILVAEDSRANQIVAAGLLGKMGHEVQIANNGAEAIAAVAAGQFDLVLMDVQMPEVDGLSAAAAIRAQESARGLRVPIVAVTAHAVKGDRERCLAAGMDAYLSKPLRGQELARVIDDVTGGSHPDAMALGPAIQRERAVSRLGGDESLFNELVGIHLGELPCLLANVQSALECADLRAVAFAAHRLCGLARTFDADLAATAAADLEDAARSGDLAAAAAAGQLLHPPFDRLRNALSALSGKGRTGDV